MLYEVKKDTWSVLWQCFMRIIIFVDKFESRKNNVLDLVDLKWKKNKYLKIK